METEWQTWREGIWNVMVERFNGHPGLAPLEQYMLRSRKEKRCVDCGELGTVEHKSVIVPSVSHYYMCAECDDYYNEKVGGNT